MKLFTNEKAVSEIVGAMLILLIIVVYLGIMQAYEVPKWNKELEKQAFDVVYSDFLNFRMNLEEPSIEMVPRTISFHTGVRYPERFILRNPGQGAYGNLMTYPLKINISYNSNGTEYNVNYTSLGFVYEMNGISDNPKLVFEHGTVFKDFGVWYDSEDLNHLETDNGIFIPLIMGIQPIYSKEVETLNILPVTQYNFTEAISSMNVTLETRYPWIWANMPPSSGLPGSQYIVEGGEIRITNIPGFNLKNLSLPMISSLSQNNIYSGTIRFTEPDTIIYAISNNMTNNITNLITNTTITNIINNLTYNITNNLTNTFTTNITNNVTSNITNNISIYSISSNCSTAGFYVWDIAQGCMNLPTSASVQKFVIKDIRFGGSVINKDILFSVQDSRGNQYKAQLHFDSNVNGDPTELTYQPIIPVLGGCNPQLSSGEIDLTSCYRNSNVGSPNVLKISMFEPGVLFAKFLIY